MRLFIPRPSRREQVWAIVPRRVPSSYWSPGRQHRGKSTLRMKPSAAHHNLAHPKPPKTLNPKPQALNPKPQTPNPKPQTPNQDVDAVALREAAAPDSRSLLSKSVPTSKPLSPGCSLNPKPKNPKTQKPKNPKTLKP